MKIVLMDENETAVLEEFNIEPRKREPQITRLIDKAKTVALASRQLEDGTWVYRRVGVERG